MSRKNVLDFSYDPGTGYAIRTTEQDTWNFWDSGRQPVIGEEVEISNLVPLRYKPKAM